MAKTLHNIFLFDVNFNKSTIELHFLLTFLMLTKFLENKKINSYVINQIFKF